MSKISQLLNREVTVILKGGVSTPCVIRHFPDENFPFFMAVDLIGDSFIFNEFVAIHIPKVHEGDSDED